MRHTLVVRIGSFAVLALAAGLGWLASQGSAATGGKPAAHHRHLGHKAAPKQFLFAQDAKAGTFTPVAGRSGVYRLALTGVRPSALYYSDKPNRIVGAVSVGKMLQGLFHKKGETPPNAAINAVDSEGQQALMGAELMSAVYDWKQQTLVYTVRTLKQGASQDRKKGLTDRILPHRLAHTALFIDTLYNECESAINNYTTQTWHLQSATRNNSNDSWGADTGYAYPYDVPPFSYGTYGEEWYGDTSGFARGCSNTVVWKSDDGTTMTIVLSDPYSGSNTYTCTLSNPNYTCTIDQTESFTSGDTLDVVWSLNPA